ncbi:MAG TPA: hypothetical protein VFE58_17610 [Tepidisphaeraceae bacterium]|jgi:hypothetical protein|nr:hypothetical protein [Tepidisphaeraceae bacterium]
MNVETDVVLMMTASVDPKGMPAAATVADPHRREADYLGALRYYLTNHPLVRRIVFAENSGWPLEKFRQLAGRHLAKEVEFLSFELNDFPRELGKSYGEMLLMDHIFQHSKLIGQTRYVAKITGRNYLINLTDMLESAPTSLQFYGDLRDHSIYQWLGTQWSGAHGESRFFVTTPEFYNRYFRDQYRFLDDRVQGEMMEDLIYRVVKQSLGEPGVIGRFRKEPSFRGLAGHLGKDYGSPAELAKQAIRRMTRKLTPWLWV